MQTFTVARESDDLHRQRWEFSLNIGYGNDDYIRLDEYAVEHKDNTRQRNWRRDGRYYRLMPRDSTIKDPPMPLEVVEMAQQHFANSVKAFKVR
jgi:hypothetical protein